MSTVINYRYVVIEDEPLIRSNIIKKIKQLYFPLTFAGEAGNGMDGILLISRELPQIIFTDIRMPQCDGLEVARYVKANLLSSKTIILSGHDDFSYAHKALQYGVSDYLLKPIKSDILKKSLQDILMILDAEQRDILSSSIDSHELTQEQLCSYIREYLKSNYKEEVSLSTLSNLLGFTQEYLGKIFKKSTGRTPSKYLLTLRMNEAKQLLLQHKELDIGKVGELVGYKDAYYFSRIFKTHVGVPPSEYRGR